MIFTCESFLWWHLKSQRLFMMCIFIVYSNHKSQPPTVHDVYIVYSNHKPKPPHDINKVKSSTARSLPVENLRPQDVGSIINYLQ